MFAFKLAYLASPYSRYPAGIEEAYREVSRQSALLLRHGVPHFSPIGHTHGVAIHGGIEAKDHSVWLPFDAPMMDACDLIIMLRMESWRESYGMAYEHDRFVSAGKPVVWMEPGVLPEEFLPGGRFAPGV